MSENVTPAGQAITRTVLGLGAEIPEELRGISSDEIYIPRIYKETSAADRLELLRGLMDTDGECAVHGSCIFGSTSVQLVDDVIWLCRSLGGKAQAQPQLSNRTIRGKVERS